jgi:C-terminal processing protease CtpA/Prc
MRKFVVLLVTTLVVSACGGGGDSVTGVGGGGQPAACSNDGQKQFVLDALYDWYLWNDLLPPNININNYASPEELVFQVTTTFGPKDANGNPLDRFSSVGSLVADQQFFGEGKYEGFGFSWREENNEMRISRVFEGSPAGLGLLARGQYIDRLNGRTYVDIRSNEGVGAFFDANDTVTFSVRQPDTSTFETVITKAIVTIDPVPAARVRIIDMGAGVPPVGYFEFRTFISTAEPVFDTVFADFIAAGVRDVVIDMRYNGGGLVRTAELLGDYLGGFANDGLVFSETEFNADRAAANNSSSFFSRLGNSLDIQRFIVVASRSTASASELVINSLAPYADVWVVGDNTFGKPVGQIGIDFCEDRILRPTSFRTKNAAGFSDYFDGLPVDCPAADLLDIPIGADNDPNLVAALSISSTGACPVAATPPGAQAAEIVTDIVLPEVRGDTARELANAW